MTWYREKWMTRLPSLLCIFLIFRGWSTVDPPFWFWGHEHELSCPQVKVFSLYINITNRQIAMKLAYHIPAPQRMNRLDFNDPMAFNLASALEQTSYFYPHNVVMQPYFHQTDSFDRNTRHSFTFHTTHFYFCELCLSLWPLLSCGCESLVNRTENNSFNKSSSWWYHSSTRCIALVKQNMTIAESLMMIYQTAVTT